MNPLAWHSSNIVMTSSHAVRVSLDAMYWIVVKVECIRTYLYYPLYASEGAS